MGSRRIDLLTVSAFLALFFATSAIETLRAALNGAYRVREQRPYPLCLLISMLFVFVSAISTLVLTWAVVVGPSVIGPADRFAVSDGVDQDAVRFELASARVCAMASPAP